MNDLGPHDMAEFERELLLQLVWGDQEIAGGKGADLESVLADADRLLRDCDP
jgi:hypothetical protein